MKKKIKILKIEQIGDLSDKELSEIAHLLGVDLKGVARELEPRKYFLHDRDKLVELLEKRWSDMRTEESITVAKRALLISIVAAIAAILSAIAAFIVVLYN